MRVDGHVWLRALERIFGAVSAVLLERDGHDVSKNGLMQIWGIRSGDEGPPFEENGAEGAVKIPKG